MIERMKELLMAQSFSDWIWSISLFAISLAFFSYLLLAYLVNYMRARSSPLQKIPGPNYSFFIGDFVDVVREPYMAPHKRWCQEFGYDQPFLRFSSLFFTQCLLILDKELVQLIFTAPMGPGSKARFSKALTDLLHSSLGDGLLILEGEDWKRHRRTLQPSFQTNFLKESLDDTVPPITDSLIDAWKKGISEVPREIDAASHLSSLALDIVGKVCFAHDFQGLRAIQKWATTPVSVETDKNESTHESELAKLDDPFISALMALLEPRLLTFVLSITLKWFGLSFLDTFVNPRVRKARQTLNDAADQVIANASADMHSKSLLHLMQVAEDPEQQLKNDDTTTNGSKKWQSRRLSHSELRDETKMFLLAGHETTATRMYWCYYVLAKHHDVQEKLYQDVFHHAPAGPIRLEHTQQMEYLHAFLQEVLRLYPPGGTLFRTNNHVEEFKGKIIPAGTRLVIPVHLLHRHPHYWDDPETFLPERWMNVSDAERERRRFAFLPFGGGHRSCIGQRFASLGAQLLLAPLVRAFTIEIGASQCDVEHEFVNFVTMKAKPALKIMIQERPGSVHG